MPSQRPTGKGSARRVGLPKARPVESSAPARDAGDSFEQPSDLSAIVNILETAMTGGVRASEAPAVVVNRTAPVAEPTTTTYQTSTAVNGPSGGTRPTEAEGAAFDEVARSLAAAEACVPLLAQSTGLMRLAALDVVKAETARAGGLLQLLRFLRGDVTPARSAVSSAAIIQRVVQAAESERRLRGIALTTRSSVADITFAGDDGLLSNALLALLLTTFALLEGVPNARVTLSVMVNNDSELGLAVSQDHVPPPAVWTTRAVPEELTGDTGTIVHGIAMSAAQRLAREWSGRFAVAAGERSSILTLWLPVLQRDDLDTMAHH